jgi:hypothetical protein
MIHQRTTIPPDVWYESDTVGTFLANRVALPIPDMVWTVYDRRSIRETPVDSRTPLAPKEGSQIPRPGNWGLVIDGTPPTRPDTTRGRVCECG